MEQRRFSLRHLKDFGFGRSTMNDLVLEEVDRLVGFLRPSAGGEVHVQSKFNLSVVNALWRISTGQSHGLDDPKLNELIAEINKIVKFEGISPLCVLAPPWLLDLLPDSWLGVDKAEKNCFDVIKRKIRQHIEDHRATYDGDDLRDFMDVYIREMNETTDPGSSFYRAAGSLNLEITLLDLFVAGSETTSTTLVWGFFLMSYYPEVQARARDAILSAVGGDRRVVLDDRASLPYIEAMIHEVLRLVGAGTGWLCTRAGDISSPQDKVARQKVQVQQELISRARENDPLPHARSLKIQTLLSAMRLAVYN